MAVSADASRLRATALAEKKSLTEQSAKQPARKRSLPSLILLAVEIANSGLVAILHVPDRMRIVGFGHVTATR
jgi:hypothetical protein